MADRKKTYALLARLHNRELEVQAKTLVDLQGEMARLEAERNLLEQRRKEGASVTMIEAMPYRGKFLDMMRQENVRISNDIDAMASHLEAQRNRVLLCYQDAKSSETLEENLHQKQLASQKTQDQAVIEEQILIRRIGGHA